jgi:small subunit ribosomal protein S7
MPRRKSVNLKREIGVDLQYGSPIIQKFINVVMRQGKKSIARTIVYDALDVLVKKSSGDKEKGLKMFERAFENIVPVIEVRPRRVGGGVYQIPVEASALGMRWLIAAAASRSDKTMGLRLAQELIEAYEGRGAAVKKKADVHRMAEANRAFSHYAW